MPQGPEQCVEHELIFGRTKLAGLPVDKPVPAEILPVDRVNRAHQLDTVVRLIFQIDL